LLGVNHGGEGRLQGDFTTTRSAQRDDPHFDGELIHNCLLRTRRPRVFYFSIRGIPELARRQAIRSSSCTASTTLTKTLSFNIYDICFARTKQHQQEYVEYIDEAYNAERLTAILTEVRISSTPISSTSRARTTIRRARASPC